MSIVGGAAIGAGLDLGDVFEPIEDLADELVNALVQFVLGKHRHLGLRALLSASLQVGPRGKTYRLRLEVDVTINGVTAVNIYEAVVFVPWFGPWEIIACEPFQAN